MNNNNIIITSKIVPESEEILKNDTAIRRN